jgi:hypothetical protein
MYLSCQILIVGLNITSIAFREAFVNQATCTAKGMKVGPHLINSGLPESGQ